MYQVIESAVVPIVEMTFFRTRESGLLSLSPESIFPRTQEGKGRDVYAATRLQKRSLAPSTVAEFGKEQTRVGLMIFLRENLDVWPECV